ncbi:major facilitator superfamily domain-containing protein 6 [Anoplophora glabripennis]|nr:major facilitator superfamily domain-containing protein 6 [Anoplophora glabripennis]XP_018565796.1 major facilitator superfamily domain-containing protein 6 [Anoplophora glabripennis]XP_018565797.1 major facilitator superfamily domain-containing protein 6 [Anoplophora glabripennis]
MKINRKLLPIKAHYFFFMAAMGPILPQLQVYGKELGISSVVMGSITGVLPIVFLIAKPAFGMLVDVYRNYRKTIFMMLISTMTISYALMNFIPPEAKVEVHIEDLGDIVLDSCNATDIQDELQCNNHTTTVICTSKCLMEPTAFLMNSLNSNTSQYRLCSFENYSLNTNNSATCGMECKEDIERNSGCLYTSFTFWSFVILMSIGTIGFNVTNSISDAICFDVIGDQYDYGKQRVWGTIGFGLSALIAGYIVNLFSGSAITYTPAIIVMLICSFFDLTACIKLKLPIIESPENIFKDIRRLLNNRTVITFIVFAVFAGIVDSFIIYYLFWYLEDLAEATGTKNIKLLEGLIVAAETLGGEVIFFSISGKILERFGHVHCFSMCFINYALRLGLISIVPSPWWVVPIEFILQGPTYALTYTTIVAYANELAPPGASATMQGIAAGMDDGFGYAIGSFLGGILYKCIGGRNAMQVFSAFGVLCSISHLVLHKTILQNHEVPTEDGQSEYKSPEEAIKYVNSLDIS